MDFNFKANTVFLARSGSHAYGTSLPESDVDVRGFAVSPKKIVLGFAYSFEQEQKSEPVDSVVYDIRKFCSLAADCNPNIIETLFVSEGDILRVSAPGRFIQENRDLFISKKARHTFSGYAISQLKRIKSHRKWLLNPPTHKPERTEYGLGSVKITPDMMGAFDKILSTEVAEEDGVEIDPNVMQLVQAEKQYRAALQQWNQLQSWKVTRNEKRSALEAQFGFDTKHAMHLVRLLRMCGEILSGKGVIVKRPDAEELLSIRRGAWTYDQLIEWAEREDHEMQDLYVSSTLPHSPDMERLNSLCIEAQEMFWERPRTPIFSKKGWEL